MTIKRINSQNYLLKKEVDDSKLIMLQKAVQKGIDSGVSNRSMEEIIQSVENRLRKNGQL